MVTTNNPDIAKKARSLKALAFGTSNKFMHEDIGFNYRMTNIQAAIGCGQMKHANELVEKRRQIAFFYTRKLESYKDYLYLPIEMNYAKSSYWMYHIVLRDSLISKRSEIMDLLKKAGIETREGFIPFNMQNIFIERGWARLDDCPNANKIAYASFYLPSGPAINEIELNYVSTHLCTIIDKLI